MKILTTRGYREKSLQMKYVDRSLRLFLIYDSPIAPGLLTKISRVDADVIHVHGYFNLVSFLACTIAASRKIPCIVTTHGYWQTGSYKRLIQLFYNRLATSVLCKAQKILVHSSDEKRMLRNIGFPYNKMEVIYNGVDIQKFHPKINGSILRNRLNLKASDHVILFVGRLTLRKGCHFLVKALPHILEKVADTVLIIIGEGAEMPRLKNLVAQLSLEDNVIFLGSFSNKELPLAYAVSDAIALPSLGEGLPLVLLEGMASGKPVIATNVGGNPEIINMTNCGILVPAGDVKKLAEAIVRVLLDEELANYLGRNGREWAEREFNWATVTEHVCKFYTEVSRNAQIADVT